MGPSRLIRRDPLVAQPSLVLTPPRIWSEPSLSLEEDRVRSSGLWVEEHHFDLRMRSSETPPFFRSPGHVQLGDASAVVKELAREITCSIWLRNASGSPRTSRRVLPGRGMSGIPSILLALNAKFGWTGRMQRVHILTGCVNMASHCIIQIFFLPVSSTLPGWNAGLSLIYQQLLALLCEESR